MSEREFQILVIDDDPFILKQVDKFLEPLKEKCELFLIDSPSKAHSVLGDNNIALILMDIHMPETSGIELIEELKKDPLYWSIPILAVSADDSMEQIIRVIEAGAVDY